MGSSSEDAPRQNRLLEEVSWIRRLAGQLVADHDLAEDLAQETCVVALQHGPREPGKLRQWLAEVLRNLLRQHARSQGRRQEREVHAARSEALEPAERLVERAFLQRELVSAVLELDEPYRSTVLLRYFDELPPREIARSTKTPLATVQSRLQRALAKLRGQLDARNSSWAVVLLPWTAGLPDLTTPTLLSLIMKTKLTLAAAAAVLVAGAFVWWSSGGEGSRPAPYETEVAQLEEGARSAPAGGTFPQPAREVQSGSARTGLAAAAAPAVAALALAPAWRVRLRVLDSEGLPMSGVAVRAQEDETVLGTSGAGGWCLFETRAERLALRAADERWVTVHEGRPSRASAVDPVLVLAPALELGGIVLDGAGRHLAGASVRFELPGGFRARFEESLEAGRGLGWRTFSDENGHYSFARVPAVAEARLTAVLAGYEQASAAAPVAPAYDVDLVLLRPRLPLAGVLRGQVLEPSGARVAAARVGLGLASVVSDDDGRFEIALARAVTAEALTAVKQGFLPARMERPSEPSEVSSGWPDHVVLVLPGAALAIHGRVVEHGGEPVPGARVWVHDPTPAAPIGQVPGFLEPLMAGANVPPAILETEAMLPQEDGDSFHDWHTTASESSSLWYWVVTDSAGRFTLSGLDQRRYRLDVLRPDSLEVSTSRAFHAGDRSAVIRLAPENTYQRFEGRVLALGSEPLEGARVRLLRRMIDTSARVFGGTSQLVVLENGATQTTDADGRFHFDDVPTQGVMLTIRGDGIVPTSVKIDAAQMEIAVDVRCHLEVVLRDSPGRFDRIEVADRDGQRLEIMVITESSSNAYTHVRLVDGRSGVVSVTTKARELRLFKGGALIETRALDLLPGDVNRVEL